MAFVSSGAFGFDVALLPVRTPIELSVDPGEFSDMEYLTEGSNSHIFTSRWRGQNVIVKMLQVDKAMNTTAIREFEIEVELLSRLHHGNVIRILGAGKRPRPYIILERLRDLNQMLGLDTPDGGGGGSFMGQRAFTFAEVLRIGKDLADALDYCHSDVHRDAMIIHRDLKPENLGIAPDGRLKLFDFGLCRCVQKRVKENDAYEMTGNTGSLRFMAPEVVLNKPYNEKCDVFSFAVVIWTIAKVCLRMCVCLVYVPFFPPSFSRPQVCSQTFFLAAQEKLPYKGYDRAMHKSRGNASAPPFFFCTHLPAHCCLRPCSPFCWQSCWVGNAQRSTQVGPTPSLSCSKHAGIRIFPDDQPCKMSPARWRGSSKVAS